MMGPNTRYRWSASYPSEYLHTVSLVDFYPRYHWGTRLKCNLNLRSAVRLQVGVRYNRITSSQKSDGAARPSLIGRPHGNRDSAICKPGLQEYALARFVDIREEQYKTLQ